MLSASFAVRNLLSRMCLSTIAKLSLRMTYGVKVKAREEPVSLSNMTPEKRELNSPPKMAAMAEEAALNFEDAIELGNFKVNLFPFRKQISCTLKSFVIHPTTRTHSASPPDLVPICWLQAYCGPLARAPCVCHQFTLRSCKVGHGERHDFLTGCG